MFHNKIGTLQNKRFEFLFSQILKDYKWKKVERKLGKKRREKFNTSKLTEIVRRRTQRAKKFQNITNTMKTISQDVPKEIKIWDEIRKCFSLQFSTFLWWFFSLVVKKRHWKRTKSLNSLTQKIQWWTSIVQIRIFLNKHYLTIDSYPGRIKKHQSSFVVIPQTEKIETSC